MRADPRIVCLVPSWTETLLLADIPVLGRTRYCCLPHELMSSIPIIGGTKRIAPLRLESLDPDLIILDKEENSTEIAAIAGDRALVTHITSLADVLLALQYISEVLSSDKLGEYADEWRNVLAHPPPKRPIEDLPGIIEWIHPLKGRVDTILYMIWNNPSMAISRNTFLGSVFRYLGHGEKFYQSSNPYPEVRLSDFNPSTTLLLFSTEPYPFHKDLSSIKELGFPSALVDGESFSWFGVRSLRFLQAALKSAGK